MFKIVSLIKSHWLYCVFFLLAVSMPIIWLKSDVLFIPEEVSFVNYQNLFDTSFFSWSDQLGRGMPTGSFNHSMIFFNAFVYKFLGFLGFNIHWMQIIYLQMMILLIFISISYFLNCFTKNKIYILLGSLFYFFNFYTAASFAYTAKLDQLILLPLFFVCTYKYLISWDYKYAVYNFLGLFFLQSIFTNLPQLVTTVAAYFIAIVYFLYINNIILFSFLRQRIVKLIIYFVLLLPIFVYHGFVFYNGQIYGKDISDVIKQGVISSPPSIDSNISAIFQLRGIWWEGESYDGVAYSHLNYYYNSWYYILASYGILISILILSIFYNKNNKIANFWLSVCLLAILFASGTKFPIIYDFLYKHVPGYIIFREPWQKFLPLVSFGFAALLMSVLNNKKIKLLTILLFIFVLVRAVPFFSNNFFDYENKGWKKLFIKPPEYWYEYEKWTKTHSNYVSTFPFLDFKLPIQYYKWYDSDLGNSRNSMYLFFGVNNITTYAFLSFSPRSTYESVLSLFIIQENINFIKLGPVDYLLEQRDVDNQNGIVSNYQKEIFRFFDDNPFSNFGNKLLLYKIKPEFHLPLFFIPVYIANTDASLEKITSIVSDKNYNLFSATYFNENNKDKILFNGGMATTSIQGVGYSKLDEGQILVAKKINPTKYKIVIKNAKGSFPLVFNNSFHKGWKAYPVYLDKFESSNINYSKGNFYETFFKEYLPEDIHLVANGYANSWVINTEDICLNYAKCVKNSDGNYDFELIIEFWPQRIYFICLFISGLSLTGSLFYLLFKRFKKK